MNLKVNEIFYSLQGEGGRTGEASIFIRLSKCNLACSYCDTNFHPFSEMCLDEIADKIIKANQAMSPRPLKSLAFK